jgi:hypothetical protein
MPNDKNPRQMLEHYIKQFGMENLLFNLIEIVSGHFQNANQPYLHNLWLSLNQALMEYQKRNRSEWRDADDDEEISANQEPTVER